MKNIFNILLFAFCFTWNIKAQEIILDLGQYEPGSKIEKDIDAGGSISFYYINALIDKNYTVSFNRKIITPPPFNFKGDEGGVTEECDKILEEFEGDYPGLTTEKEVYERKLKDIEKMKNCDVTYKDRIKNFAKIKIEENVEVAKNEEYSITISRDGATWTFIFKAPTSGEWGLYYGFTFAVDLKEQDTYFSKYASSSMFTITKQENRKNGIYYYPTVGYQWQKNTKNVLVPSIQGGLGSNLEEVIVMLGGSLIYHYNLSLSAGVILHKKHFLKGKYKEGDTVDENLDFDQLHDQHYRPNLYVGINFRFAENPFKKSEN